MTKDTAIGDTTGRDTPSTQLDLYNRVIEPQTDDEFLNANNVGTGVYEDGEMWQQVELFSQSMVADAVFSAPLEGRARQEAKREIARSGYDYEVKRGPNDVERQSFPAYENRDEQVQDLSREEYADLVWDELPELVRYDAMRQLAGYSPSKRDPFARTLLSRHEFSRSRDGRLVDNSLTQVRETRGENGEERRRNRR